jgi:hypothetical protein
MEAIRNLFGERVKPPKPKRSSERGDLLEYFTARINRDRDGKKFKKLPISAMAWKLKGLTLKDLYYMKSYMQDLDRSGKDAVKWFWWSLRPENKEELGAPELIA